MEIGSWGDIVFEVSSEAVRTFDALKQKSSGRWSVHEPISSNPKPEYLGAGQGRIEFTMHLAASLGINVREEKERIEQFVREGRNAPLMIALQPVTMGDWYAESAETTLQWVGNNGDLELINILIVMREYF